MCLQLYYTTLNTVIQTHHLLFTPNSNNNLKIYNYQYNTYWNDFSTQKVIKNRMYDKRHYHFLNSDNIQLSSSRDKICFIKNFKKYDIKVFSFASQLLSQKLNHIASGSLETF